MPRRPLTIPRAPISSSVLATASTSTSTKAILSIASTFFRDMFSLPLKSATSAFETSFVDVEIPFVDVEEDGSTWEQLLHFIYPIAQLPRMDSFEVVETLLAASAKYQMDDVKKRVSHALLSHPALEEQPVRMYTIAARHCLHDVMRAAAKASLQRPILDYPSCKELDDIPASSYRRLEEFHVRCGLVTAFVTLAGNYPWCPGFKSFESSTFLSSFPSTGSGSGCKCKDGKSHVFGSGHRYFVRAYVDDYLSRVAAELKTSPLPAVANDTTILEPAMKAGANVLLVSPLSTRI